MTETMLSVPVSELIPILTTIAARDWEGFKKLEEQFVTKYGFLEWQDFFADRLKPYNFLLFIKQAPKKPK